MRLDAIPVWVMLALCVSSAVGLIILWVPRLPKGSLRIRMYIACLAPIPSMYATASLRGWSQQVIMAYYVVVVGALFLGSLGRGKEIVAIGRAYVERGPDGPEPRISRSFSIQVVASLAMLFLLTFFLLADF